MDFEKELKVIKGESLEEYLTRVSTFIASLNKEEMDLFSEYMANFYETNKKEVDEFSEKMSIETDDDLNLISGIKIIDMTTGEEISFGDVTEERDLREMLNEELEEAISSENYEYAAQLRDQIKRLEENQDGIN